MVINGFYDVLKKRFNDGYVNSPLDFKYILQLQFMMSSIGSWPYKRFGRHRLGAIFSIFNFFIIAFAFTQCTLSLIYIKLNMDRLSFFFLGHVLLCWIFAMLYLSKLVTFRTNKIQETIKEYLLEFHLFYFKNRSPYAAEIHTQSHIASGVFTIIVANEIIFGVVLFIFMPLYNNYSRGLFSAHRPENSTFEHSVYFYMPDAVYTTVEGYWILFSVNIFVSYVTSCGICVFDLLLSLMVLQIWGHLRILNHNLLDMPPLTDSSGMYTVEENDQIRTILLDNILHHKFIIKFVDRCSHAFSEYLFLFYFGMQFITCILLLEVTSFTADSLAKYGMLTFAMHLQLFQVSVLFEMLNTKSEQLIDTVYATPWEHMNTNNRRTVLFLLHRMQSPVSLKAAKVVPVGVHTLFSVLKTTFSCYMMLKTLAGER